MHTHPVNLRCGPGSGRASVFADLPIEILARVVVRLDRLSEVAALGACCKPMHSFTQPVLVSVLRIVAGGNELADMPDQARFVLPAALHMYVRKLLRQVELGRFRLREHHLQALIACASRQSASLRLRELMAAQRVGGQGMDHALMLEYLTMLSRHSPREAMSLLLPFFRRLEAGDAYQRLGMKVCKGLLSQATSAEALVAALAAPAAELPPDYASAYMTGLLRLPHFEVADNLDTACRLLAQPVLALPPVWQPPPLMALFDLVLTAHQLTYPPLFTAWLDCMRDDEICRLHRMWHGLPSVISLAAKVLEDADCLAFCRAVLAQGDSLLRFGRDDLQWWLQGRRDGWPHALCRWIRTLDDEDLRNELWQQLKLICDAHLPRAIGLEVIIGEGGGRTQCALL